MSQSPPHNRRVYLRIPVTLRAEVIDESVGATIYFVTRDLGIGGLFLQSELLFDIGTPILIRFHLPDSGETCSIQSRVAWTNDDVDEAAGMGVTFESMDAATRRCLSQFVQRLGGRVTYD